MSRLVNDQELSAHVQTVCTRYSFLAASPVAGNEATIGSQIVTPIRNDPGRVRSPHTNVYGPTCPKSPPHGKEGRNKIIDRPT